MKMSKMAPGHSIDARPLTDADVVKIKADLDQAFDRFVRNPSPRTAARVGELQRILKAGK